MADVMETDPTDCDDEWVGIERLSSDCDSPPQVDGMDLDDVADVLADCPDFMTVKALLTEHFSPEQTLEERIKSLGLECEPMGSVRGLIEMVEHFLVIGDAAVGALDPSEARSAVEDIARIVTAAIQRERRVVSRLVDDYDRLTWGPASGGIRFFASKTDVREAVDQVRPLCWAITRTCFDYQNLVRGLAAERCDVRDATEALNAIEMVGGRLRAWAARMERHAGGIERSGSKSA
jgi:hypothetical protein